MFRQLPWVGCSAAPVEIMAVPCAVPVGGMHEVPGKSLPPSLVRSTLTSSCDVIRRRPLLGWSGAYRPEAESSFTLP
jgi:hypothetical protein